MKIELTGLGGDKKIIDTDDVIEVFLSVGYHDYTKVGTIEHTDYYAYYVKETPKEIFNMIYNKGFNTGLIET